MSNIPIPPTITSLMVPKTILSAGGIVYRRTDNNQIEVLLIQQHGVWTVPKGRVEQGETLGETAVREVLEETGISAAITAPGQSISYRVSHNGIPHHKVVVLYLMQALHGYLRPRRAESIRHAVWLPLSEALKRIRHRRIRDVVALAVMQISP